MKNIEGCETVFEKPVKTGYFDDNWGESNYYFLFARISEKKSKVSQTWISIQGIHWWF